MKKAILIDDRKTRQQNLSLDIEVVLQHPLLEISDINVTKVVDLMKSGQTDFFDDFEVIICHRSFLTQEYRINLTDYIKNKKKKLVLFSGGTPLTRLNES